MALRLREATTILREDSQAEFRASVTSVSTFIATGAGTGLSPRAPGTVGSLFGLGCFGCCQRVLLLTSGSPGAL